MHKRIAYPQVKIPSINSDHFLIPNQIVKLLSHAQEFRISNPTFYSFIKGLSFGFLAAFTSGIPTGPLNLYKTYLQGYKANPEHAEKPPLTFSKFIRTSSPSTLFRGILNTAIYDGARRAGKFGANAVPNQEGSFGATHPYLKAGLVSGGFDFPLHRLFDLPIRHTQIDQPLTSEALNHSFVRTGAIAFLRSAMFGTALLPQSQISHEVKTLFPFLTKEQSTLLAGILSGTAASLFTHPLDAVITQICSKPNETVFKVCSNASFSSLFAGSVPRACRFGLGFMIIYGVMGNLNERASALGL